MYLRNLDWFAQQSMAALYLGVDILLVQKPNQGLAIYLEFYVLLVKLTVLMIVLEE